nr:transposase (putative), gypsy type [Tanacetum cinerariifolium]
MVRDSVQLETAVNTITHEYLLEFTSEYGIAEVLRPELPGPGDRIVDFPEARVLSDTRIPAVRYRRCQDSLKNWNNRFFWVDKCVFPTAVEWRTNASKDGMPASGTYYVEAVRVLDTHRTPIQKQPEALLCLVGISRRYYLGDDVYPTFHYDDDRGGETAAPEMPPPEEVPLATVPGAGQAVEAVVAKPLTVRESRKRGPEGVDDNAPPKSLRRDHTDRPLGSSRGGKSLAAMQLCLDSNVFMSEGVPTDVSDPDPLAFVDALSYPPVDVAQSSQGIAVAEDSGSENASSPIEVLSPGSVYRPEWGVTNGSLLDTPEACQDLVDHVALPGYFTELRHMSNDEFLRQYNVNLARQVAMGWQLRLSGEKKLKAAFEEFKRYEDDRVEQRCAELDARLDALSIDFDEELYPHMLTAIAGRRWVIGHGLRLAMMKCAESLEMRQAFADKSVAQVARREKRIQDRELEIKNLKVLLETKAEMKRAAEGKNAELMRELEDIRAQFSSLKVSNEHLSQRVAALQEQVSEEEKLKAAFEEFKWYEDDRVEQRYAPMDVIMAALYLKSDTEGDAPQYIRDLRPSSSQLTIPVYPEVRDPRNPWACKEEIALADAIEANISRAEKKKKCRICILCSMRVFVIAQRLGSSVVDTESAAAYAVDHAPSAFVTSYGPSHFGPSLPPAAA